MWTDERVLRYVVVFIFVNKKGRKKKEKRRATEEIICRKCVWSPYQMRNEIYAEVG